MAFIGEYWYIWLVVMFVGHGLVVLFHINRTMKAIQSISGGDLHEGTGKLIVAQAIGALSLLLLIISVVVNIIDYAR